MNTNSKSSNSSSFIFHFFGKTATRQANGDLLLNGRIIPHGYVNVTELLKAVSNELGKRKTWSNYRKSENACEFLDALSEENNTFIENSSDAPYDASIDKQSFQPLVIVIKGGNADEQGIYTHLEVAIHLMQWASPKFAVKATKVLKAVMNGDVVGITNESQKQIAEIQQISQEYRLLTKETFWFVTDSIKNYYIQNPRIEKYPSQNYSEYFDCLNVGLFGKKSKQISEELGIAKGNLNRDNFGKNSLKKIEMIQRISESQIKLGLNPLDACKKALEIMNYEIGNFKE